MTMRLASRVFNVPLLVCETYLDTLSQFMRARLEGRAVELDYEGQTPVNTRQFYMMDGDQPKFVDTPAESSDQRSVAVVPVMGTMMSRATMLDSLSSDGRGYDAIKNDINASLRDSDIGGAVLHVDTFGGEAARNFELARWMRGIQAETDKPIWAVVDEAAYSAGYSLASAAERIITTQSGGVGSIGVRVAHVSREKMLKKQGVDVTLITAGKYKGEGNPFQRLDQQARDSIQADIDHIYDQFATLVADHRDLTVDQVKGTEAAKFNADDALANGLIDDIMPTGDAFAEFHEHINSDRGAVSVPAQITGSSAATTTGKSMTTETTYTQAEHDAAVAEAVSAAVANVEKSTAESIHARYDALLSHENGSNVAAVQKLAKSSMDLDEAIGFMADVSAATAAPQSPEPDYKAVAAKAAADAIAALRANASDTAALDAGTATIDADDYAAVAEAQRLAGQKAAERRQARARRDA